MTDLYTRILLWHKLVAMQTGGLALCSAKHRLNVTEARGWIEALRNVSDDIEAFLKDGTFVLDGKGQRVVGLSDRAAPIGTISGSSTQRTVSRSISDELPPPKTATGGGTPLRKATRKQ